MADDTLKHLRALHEAATPGPWEWDRSNSPYREYDIHSIESVHRGRIAHAVWSRDGALDPDYELIAAMRNALPALLDVAEAAERCLTHGVDALTWQSTDAVEALEAALAKLGNVK